MIPRIVFVALAAVSLAASAQTSAQDTALIGLWHAAEHDPQPSNPNQVMVIMLSVELGIVDQSHRHLKLFMKRRGFLQFR